MTKHEEQRDRGRVLIADFDVFTAIGGGQVFYRRVAERNPSLDFYYYSCSDDVRIAGQLPANVHPVLCDPRLEMEQSVTDEEHWVDKGYAIRVACMANAVQGMTFQAVDVPSFFPVAHLIRPIMTAYGVTVERVALGLVGWASVSAKSGYEPTDSTVLAQIEKAELASMEAADIRYTISHGELGQNTRVPLPITVLDMHDAIEVFPSPDPTPPGSGVPDVWYVGRLDGAKGPDLFLELISRMPRHLYGRCFLSGPDDVWSAGTRWSQHLLQLAKSLGVEASYEGVLSDAEIRRRVYRGRTIVVVPSRTDAFNYVALEAILNGCPILLSERTGAYGFLRDEHPHLLPPTMEPGEMKTAAEKLEAILSNYEEVAQDRRQELRARPFPAPRSGFMDVVYNGSSAHSSEMQAKIEHGTNRWRESLPLISPSARNWRTPRPQSSEPRVTVVIPTLNRAELLGPTLSCLTRQILPDIEVVVVDDGSMNASRVRSVAEAFAPLVRLLRVANGGEAAAVNHGIEAARGEYVAFLSDDDVYSPELLSRSVAVLDENADAIGTFPDWDVIDTAGYLVEEHRLPEFDRKLMLVAHWCLPGPGAVIRRKTLQRVGGRDTSFQFVSDFDLWLRATKYGQMVHLPQKLAYWRLHGLNLSNSNRLRQMAQERITLLEKFFMDPEEDWILDVRNRAYAAANLAAGAILGRAEPDEAIRCLAQAAQLAPDLMENLPANMAGYPELWPPRPEHLTA